MQHSRSDRLAKTRLARKRRLAVGAVAVAAIVVALGVIAGVGGLLVPDALPTAQPAAADGAADAGAEALDLRSVFSAAEASAAPYLAYGGVKAADATLVEVPDVVGREMAAAVAVLEAAGLRPDAQGTPSGSGEITDQQPHAGEIVGTGSLVRLVTTASWIAKTPGGRRAVVCIDPGHQSRSNVGLEPIGPGATTLKAKVTGGATGVVTHVAEYEIALQIAMNVRARLKDYGLEVVMTRTTDDVDMSNAERAKAANRVSADLFVRIHANGSTDPRDAGVSLLYPAASGYTKATSAASKRAALALQRSVLSASGAPSDGIYARSDLAGFNWCSRPAVLIECGYLTNPVEDRLLASPAYQDKIALGIARGVLTYLAQ